MSIYVKDENNTRTTDLKIIRNIKYFKDGTTLKDILGKEIRCKKILQSGQGTKGSFDWNATTNAYRFVPWINYIVYGDQLHVFTAIHESVPYADGPITYKKLIDRIFYMNNTHLINNEWEYEDIDLGLYIPTDYYNQYPDIALPYPEKAYNDNNSIFPVIFNDKLYIIGSFSTAHINVPRNIKKIYSVEYINNEWVASEAGPQLPSYYISSGYGDSVCATSEGIYFFCCNWKYTSSTSYFSYTTDGLCIKWDGTSNNWELVSRLPNGSNLPRVSYNKTYTTGNLYCPMLNSVVLNDTVYVFVDGINYDLNTRPNLIDSVGRIYKLVNDEFQLVSYYPYFKNRLGRKSGSNSEGPVFTSIAATEEVIHIFFNTVDYVYNSNDSKSKLLYYTLTGRDELIERDLEYTDVKNSAKEIPSYTYKRGLIVRSYTDVYSGVKFNNLYSLGLFASLSGTDNYNTGGGKNNRYDDRIFEIYSEEVSTYDINSSSTWSRFKGENQQNYFDLPFNFNGGIVLKDSDEKINIIRSNGTVYSIEYGGQDHPGEFYTVEKGDCGFIPDTYTKYLTVARRNINTGNIEYWYIIDTISSNVYIYHPDTNIAEFYDKVDPYLDGNGTVGTAEIIYDFLVCFITYNPVPGDWPTNTRIFREVFDLPYKFLFERFVDVMYKSNNAGMAIPISYNSTLIFGSDPAPESIYVWRYNYGYEYTEIQNALPASGRIDILYAVKSRDRIYIFGYTYFPPSSSNPRYQCFSKAIKDILDPNIQWREEANMSSSYNSFYVTIGGGPPLIASDAYSNGNDYLYLFDCGSSSEDTNHIYRYNAKSSVFYNIFNKIKDIWTKVKVPTYDQYGNCHIEEQAKKVKAIWVGGPDNKAKRIFY